jgi:hypothetical protein
MIVAQASLTPDLLQARPTSPSIEANDVRTGAAPEAALWLLALTATGLVVAAVLLLGLLVQSAVRDASMGGFAFGVAVMIAALGIGALAYVLVAARRAGWLGALEDAPVPAASRTPSGMHVVAAVPADPARRKRRELQDERSARSQQAKAIAAAAVVSDKPRPRTQQPPAPRPATPQQSIAGPTPERVAPTVARPASAPGIAPRVAPPAPVGRAPSPALSQPGPPAAIRMPRPPVHAPRPVAWATGAPVVRMGAPRMHPRTQAAMFQVNAANVRTPAPAWRR